MQEIAVGEENFHIAPLYRLLCDMQNNREIYQLLLNNSANDDFPAETMQESIEFLKDKTTSLNIREEEKSDYLFQYLVYGCISVVQNWMNDEMKESPMKIKENNHAI